eukprot:UN16659
MAQKLEETNEIEFSSKVVFCEKSCLFKTGRTFTRISLSKDLFLLFTILMLSQNVQHS